MLNSTIFREWSSSAGPSGPIGSARTAAFDAVNGTGGPVMHRILERLNADAIEMFFGEVTCSQAMYDDLAARGGNPIMWKTGHSLIKAKMKEAHAELAGEMSGHMFFADRYYGFDEALYAACRLMEIVAHSGRPLSAQLAAPSLRRKSASIAPTI